MHRTLEASGIVGCVGIIVDAKDDSAGSFYAKYGFTALGSGPWPRRMFLPLETLRAAFAD